MSKTDFFLFVFPNPNPLHTPSLSLQIANVSRIMKGAVPPTSKIAKDAKECVQECVSEFISFITSEAAEKCQLEKRKTIGGEDILYAMGALGFENYAETLKIHLAKLRQVCRFCLVGFTPADCRVVLIVCSNRIMGEGPPVVVCRIKDRMTLKTMNRKMTGVFSKVCRSRCLVCERIITHLPV